MLRTPSANRAFSVVYAPIVSGSLRPTTSRALTKEPRAAVNSSTIMPNSRLTSVVGASSRSTVKSANATSVTPTTRSTGTRKFRGSPLRRRSRGVWQPAAVALQRPPLLQSRATSRACEVSGSVLLAGVAGAVDSATGHEVAGLPTRPHGEPPIGPAVPSATTPPPRRSPAARGGGPAAWTRGRVGQCGGRRPAAVRSGSSSETSERWCPRGRRAAPHQRRGRRAARFLGRKARAIGAVSTGIAAQVGLQYREIIGTRQRARPSRYTTITITINFGPPVSSPSSAGGITPRMNPMFGM